MATYSIKHTYLTSIRAKIMTIKNIANVITKTEQSLAAVPLRVIAGIIFAAHGAQKLFAWFFGIF